MLENKHMLLCFLRKHYAWANVSMVSQEQQQQAMIIYISNVRRRKDYKWHAVWQKQTASLTLWAEKSMSENWRNFRG